MPRVQQKRGTDANLTSVDPTPLAGELIVVSDENSLKIGNGSDAYTSLDYVTATPRSHTHLFSEISDITFPDPLADNSIVVYSAGVGWITASTIGLIGVGSQPLGGWPSGSIGAALAGKASTTHASSHATGGSDALSPSDIGAAPAASPTFTGDVTIDDKIIHAGDNSAIRFPADDTVTIETAGVERVRVRSDGNVAVGSGGFSSVRMSVEGAASGYGLYANPTFSSGDPRTARFQASIAANSSVGEFSVVDVNGAIMNSGATVTTAVGLHVRSTLAVGTNNYGIISRVPAGADNWNVFADGGGQNYFFGSVGIGAARLKPNSALDVNGVITVSAGSAAAPALVSGTGTSDSGIFWPAADTVAISTAGVERVRVDSSGNTLMPIAKMACYYSYNYGIGTPDSSGLQVFSGDDIRLGGMLSGTFTDRLRVKSTGSVRFVPLAADPASGNEAGDVYYNSSTNKLRVYNGSSWVDLH